MNVIERLFHNQHSIVEELDRHVQSMDCNRTNEFLLRSMVMNKRRVLSKMFQLNLKPTKVYPMFLLIMPMKNVEMDDWLKPMKDDYLSNMIEHFVEWLMYPKHIYFKMNKH